MAALVAVFLGAFLLFNLELMAAKALLPRFGGAAQVWTAAMTFYQGVLLAGYLYVQRVLARLGPARYARGHLLLLFAPLIFFPLGVSAAAGSHPVFGVIAALTVSIGAPFFVLSMTTPVVQSLAEQDGGEAYHLFAASNAGSLAALVGYPFLFEPFLTLQAQFVWWQALYLLYALAMSFHLVSGPKWDCARVESGRLPSWGQRFQWALLSAGPSAALLAATKLISWDLAAVPLLWVLPLALYLLTFILCFKKNPWYPEHLGTALAWLMAVWFLAVLVTALYSSGLPDRWQLLRRLWVLNKFLFVNASFFIFALISHRVLSLSRPAGRAAEFYAAVAAGGWAGSLLVSVALPLLARRSALVELDWAAAGALSFAALFRAGRPPSGRALRPAALCALALVAAGGTWLFFKRSAKAAAGEVLALRNFYGIHRVAESEGRRALYHGNTLHGLQYSDAARRRQPLLYFHRRSPCGEAFAVFGPEARRVAVLGLGAGTLAAYGRAGQEFDFYELDADVAKIARERFTYLADSPARVTVTLGDGRLSLAARAGAAYDILVLDVFTGGAIPTHFLTREALALYGERLASGGVVLLHVSNRFLDLRPVLAALAKDAGFSGATKMSDRAKMTQDEESFSSWVVLARDPATLAPLKRLGWDELELHDKGLRPWTDGYASLWSALGG